MSRALKITVEVIRKESRKCEQCFQEINEDIVIAHETREYIEDNEGVMYGGSIPKELIRTIINMLKTKQLIKDES